MIEQQAKRPWVTVHFAQSLDGRIATRTGDSQWIGGQAERRLAHQLRAAHQAIMVGVGTVVADDPRLTVRLAPGDSPRRIVADSTLRLPLTAQLLSDGADNTLVATTARAPSSRLRVVRARGAEVLVLDQDGRGRVHLGALLRQLKGLGIESVLIEGGRGLITSALSCGLVDRLVICIAPKIIGAGIESIGDLNVRSLSEAVTFTQASFTQVEEDVIFDGLLRS